MLGGAGAGGLWPGVCGQGPGPRLRPLGGGTHAVKTNVTGQLPPSAAQSGAQSSHPENKGATPPFSSTVRAGV